MGTEFQIAMMLFGLWAARRQASDPGPSSGNAGAVDPADSMPAATTTDPNDPMNGQALNLALVQSSAGKRPVSTGTPASSPGFTPVGTGIPYIPQQGGFVASDASVTTITPGSGTYGSPVVAGPAALVVQPAPELRSRVVGQPVVVPGSPTDTTRPTVQPLNGDFFIPNGPILTAPRVGLTYINAAGVPIPY
jgi:hypothetical protein